MKILLTGFEPFNGLETNPTEKIIRNFVYNDVETLLLPVSYLSSIEILKRKIAETKPDIVISLGLANMRKTLSLEQVAQNKEGGKIADNDGNIIEIRSIDENKKEKYLSMLDLVLLVEALRDNNIDAYVSIDAGTFVCNKVYFYLLSNGINSLFIHFPSEENLSINKGEEALKIIINKIKDGYFQYNQKESV